MHTLAGVEVQADITEAIAQEMLRGQWRYIFRDAELTDRDKVARMLGTQIALAVDKREGMFVLDGIDGKHQKWLVPNAMIGPVCITDADGRRIPGFGPLEMLPESGSPQEPDLS